MLNTKARNTQCDLKPGMSIPEDGMSFPVRKIPVAINTNLYGNFSFMMLPDVWCWLIFGQ